LSYSEIPLGESDTNKSDEQKKLEHELICLMNSWRPDKERIKKIKQNLKTMEEKKYTVMKDDTGKLYIHTGGEVELTGTKPWFQYVWNPVKHIIDPQCWVEGETVSDKDWVMISGSVNHIMRNL
jgi:hypothetical protein